MAQSLNLIFGNSGYSANWDHFRELKSCSLEISLRRGQYCKTFGYYYKKAINRYDNA